MINTSFASAYVPEDIRVGLYSGTRAVKSFTVSSEEGMQIGLVNEDGEFELLEEFDSNEEVTIKRGNNSNSVEVEGIGEIGDSENFVRIIPNESDDVTLLKVNDNNYRGEIEVRRFSNI